MGPPLLALAALALQEGHVPVSPRAIVREQRVARWDFTDGVEGWKAVHDAQVANRDGRLVIEANGDDPYLLGPAITAEGPLLVRLSAHFAAGGRGQVFWITRQSPGWDEAKSAHFPLRVPTGTGTAPALVQFTVELGVQGELTQLRLDPGSGPGHSEIDWIEVVRVERHPLEIERVEHQRDRVLVTLRNHGAASREGRLSGQRFALGANARRTFSVPVTGKVPLEAIDLVATSEGLPDVTRTVTILHEDVEAEWVELTNGTRVVQVAPDASCARLKDGDQVVAWLAPLAARAGKPLAGVVVGGRSSLTLTGEGWHATVLWSDTELQIFQRGQDLEGPVLRLPGPVLQAVFPGQEFLGKGERSSSTLDIETAEHVRFAPDPRTVTAPYLAAVTERGGAALVWQDTTAQPLFAVPDFVDGTPEVRMAVRGSNLQVAVVYGRSKDLVALILESSNRSDPHARLPEPARDVGEQPRLERRAFEGPLRGSDGNGWGHCAEASWPRAFHADHVSALFRLTGEAPPVPGLAPGGGHIRDDTAWFVTGRAKEWLDVRTAEVRAIAAEQKPDGSFRYEGPFRKGHYEDTASGWCAAKALVLLEHARLTGDGAARDAGLRALAFMKRFDVPRGAQTWELSLHTPDILAAAHLVSCFVRGFQLTGDATLLAEAHRWATYGLPFVYLWGDRPTMAYATIPVFGATWWRAPNWIGLPVQWCGLNYAFALLELDSAQELAPLEARPRRELLTRWRQAAEGILRAAERMQCPDGPYVGCLPDSFDLAAQRGSGPMINPSALVRVRARLTRGAHGLAAAANERHRVVAPFQVALEGDLARVFAWRGVRYQILVDNTRGIDVTSAGVDRIELGGR